LVLVVLTTASAERRRMAALAVLVWVGYAVFYPWRGLGPQPNYQWPTWWTVPVAIASGIYLMRRWVKPLWPLGIAAVWVVSLAQTSFLLDWMGFIRDRGGTRGVHYGTVLTEQRRAIGEACRRAPANVMLEAQTIIFETSIRYLFDLEPACAGRSLYFSRGVWISEQPPPSGQPVTKVRFSYARADSARLRVEVVP
jgi:hypothetical protein